MDNIKLKVLYVPYKRYEDCAPCIGHITGDSFSQAIVKMLDRVRMYTDGEEILEREQELGRELTQEEIIELLVGQNGDGCDYIVCLENEVTGEKYIDEDTGYEEWHM